MCGTEQRLKECEEALLNMIGCFCTPVARLKIKGDIPDEARLIALEYRDKYIKEKVESSLIF